MRVFVAGATGAIGRPLVSKLEAAGHEVIPLRRSDADVYDPDRLREVMVEARPDVVVHELTKLPDRMNFRNKNLYTETNRLRTEGTRNLLDGARAAGARRFVCQSIAFVYEQAGDWVKDEDAPLFHSDSLFGRAIQATKEMERMVTEAEGLEGVVLRYGFFYGPGTHYAPDGGMAKDVRRRLMAVVGNGEGLISFIHVEDAAEATVAAVSRGAPGIYNIVDDEPAPMQDWLPVYAEAIGAGKPMRVPRVAARMVAGPDAAALATELRGASNAKAKRELGWEPRYRSWRDGFREALG